MKIKTLLCISLIAILVFVIYLTTIDREVYYLNLSTLKESNSYDKQISTYLKEEAKLEKYISEYVSEDDRVTDLIYSIKENSSVTINGKQQTIKNALIKADLVTLFIGLNDINYKVGYSSVNELYNYADSFLKDMEELLELVREYCKEDIVIIGYYNLYGSYYDEYFDYINREIKSLADDYNLTFVSTTDIYDIDNHQENIDFNTNEHNQLATKIIEFINKKIINKKDE